MDVPIALRYSNGRTHETVYRDVPGHFGPGFEFDLHGRRWQVVGPARKRFRPDDQPIPILCVSVTSAALADGGKRPTAQLQDNTHGS